jgi:hypothetical protein
MAKRSETVEDVAKHETALEHERAERREDYRLGNERLVKDVPARFLKLARDLREVVRRFNVASEPERRLEWRESAALAVGSTDPNADLNLSFWRKNVETDVRLVVMNRPIGPDAYLIEATGRIKDKPFAVRIEGGYTSGKLEWRITIDFKRVDLDIDDVAEWLVLAVLKEELPKV